MTPLRPVLLIRPDANDRDARALLAHGVDATVEPWLEVRTATSGAEARRLAELMADADAGTVLIITSPRTWRHWAELVGCEQLVGAAGDGLDKGLRVICTGSATRASLPARLAERAESAPTGAAIARLLAGEPAGGGVALLPGSDIAREELPTALTRAGWRVERVAVYRTSARKDRPASADGLARGAFSAVLLRSPSAVAALRRHAQIPAGTVLAAAGPTTAVACREAGWSPLELGTAEANEMAVRLARALGAVPRDRSGRGQGVAAVPEPGPAGAQRRDVPDPLHESPFLAACRGERPGRTPVWFMRQAGRSLPEYRAAREGTAMLDSCLDPELAAELTLQPVRRYGVDAAIFYSDIMVPLKLAGVDVDIKPGIGPVLGRPVRTRADVDRLPTLTRDALEPIRQGVSRAVSQLGDTPLIGFAGAPYTVASYLVEGRPDRNRPHTKAMLNQHPDTWRALVDWVADVDIMFLQAQVAAGARAVQLFDSWVGELDPTTYLAHVQPYSARVLRTIGGLGVPRIHFGTGTARLLPHLRDAGADVMGVGDDITLDAASELLGGRTPLQGNIDPELLSGPLPALEAGVRAVLRAGRAAPSHIVNLAHGVPKDTDPDVLAHVVAMVHDQQPSTEGR